MRGAWLVLGLVGCGGQSGWIFQPFEGPGWDGELVVEHEAQP